LVWQPVVARSIQTKALLARPAIRKAQAVRSILMMLAMPVVPVDQADQAGLVLIPA
jgi:hypothetical protein